MILPGLVEKLRHVVDLELLMKPLAVPHHGGRFEAHRIGNLVGGLPGGDQSQDGDFLVRQGDLGSGFVVFHKAITLKPLQKYTKKIRKTPHVYVEMTPNPLKIIRKSDKSIIFHDDGIIRTMAMVA